MALDPRQLVIFKAKVSVAETGAPKAVTVNHATGVLTAPAHGYADDMELMVWAGLDGAMPGGLTAKDHIYYVVASDTDTFKLASTPGGEPLTLTSDGADLRVIALTWVRLGEVPKCTWTPKVEKKEHKSNQSGVEEVDKTLITGKSAMVSLEVEEMSSFNLGLITGGTVAADGTAGDIITLLDQPARTVALKVEGTNDGQRTRLVVPKITLTPSGALDFIGSDWAKGSVEGSTETLEGHPYPQGLIRVLPLTA